MQSSTSEMCFTILLICKEITVNTNIASYKDTVPPKTPIKTFDVLQAQKPHSHKSMHNLQYYTG